MDDGVDMRGSTSRVNVEGELNMSSVLGRMEGVEAVSLLLSISNGKNEPNSRAN